MKEGMSRVSVLMPAYNAEKYIGEAIESILNQTFTDFEFIIVNDGSTDDTAKIIEEYAAKDKRIKFVNNSKNKGLISVLNEGLDLCRGEYIARMDSDDIALPERFAKQVTYMDMHPECGACGTWAKKFGAGIKENNLIKNQEKIKLLDFLIYGSRVIHPSSVIRKSVLVDNNIRYDSKYKYAEDYALWIEIVKYAEIHNLQEVLLNYRWHDSNVSVVNQVAQYECAERIRKSILEGVLTSEEDIEKLLCMTREVNERFWLFGFLPIVRRKQYSITKTKYYLFEKLPIIKEQDGKIYLFEKIRIGDFR